MMPEPYAAMRTSEAFGRALLRRRRRQHSDTFDVGVLIPLSGTCGLLGPSSYACAQFARDLWNRDGGCDGREVRITVFNSSEDATNLASDLRHALDEDALDAVVNLSNTAICRTVSEVIDGRVPLVYTPHYEGVGLPDWVHAIGETPDRQLLPAIDWLSDRHRVRRWYLLGHDYSWPRRTHKAARETIRARGGEVVRERYIPLGERDFDAIVEDIAWSGADVVVVSLIGGESIYLGRAFGAAGLCGKVLRLSICLEENTILGMGEANTDGMYVSSAYFASVCSRANQSFKERYWTHFGDRAPMLNSFSQSVYEGFVHLRHQAQADGLSPESLAQGLPGTRSPTGFASDATSCPIYLGVVEGLDIRVIRTLDAAPG
jgi:urea transport system substrate-binding protein